MTQIVKTVCASYARSWSCGNDEKITWIRVQNLTGGDRLGFHASLIVAFGGASAQSVPLPEDGTLTEKSATASIN